MSYHCKTISYAWAQARGQLHVLRKAVPVAEIINNKNTPDSVRNKLLLIENIRQFAIDSLGLKNTKNYQKMYDQKGQPILKVVIASEKYALKALKWKFPIIGSFEYKGFFDFSEAEKLENELIAKGYDTEISDVAAWSTLGWFKDPILSSMLFQDEGHLADLIIHEMTHSTIFIKNQHELNENLANFIGKYGALAFLKAKFGADSPELTNYLEDLSFSEVNENFLSGASKELQKYYESDYFIKSNQKDSLKNQKLTEIKKRRDSLLVANQRVVRSTMVPNNAFYVGYLTYHSKQNEFEQELKNTYKNDFKKYLNELKQRYSK